MDKVIFVFNSFAESDEADKNYYRNLSPEERLQILLARKSSLADKRQCSHFPRT